MVAQHRVDAIIIDQLSYIQAEGREIREQQVAAASRAVKLVAGDCNVATFLMAQLNSNQWQRENKEPNQNDLRESRGIYHDADFVLFVHRPFVFDKEADPKDATIIIGKAREGVANTSVPVQFIPEETRFIGM